MPAAPPIRRRSAGGDAPAAAPPATTLAQRAHAELHAALIRGDFLPGATLTLRGLAERLGTSIMPVREAVSRLAAEQALELRPNRAIVVPELSRRDSDDLWELRRLIESEAAALAAETATADDLAALAGITAAMWQALQDGQARGFVEGTGRWAMTLARVSRSRSFHDYVSNLRLRCAPYIAQAFAAGIPAEDGFFRFTLLLQEQITEALRDADAPRARELRAADVRTFQAYVYRRLGWT